MKTLIIPDIHTNYKLAEKIILEENADKIVFLGDYFDEFYDNASIAQNTAEWLKESLNKPNRIHLFGNHDVNYAFHDDSYKCSGYSAGKDIAINSVLKTEDWKKLSLFTWVGSWLCSHAGVHPYWYSNQNIPFKEYLSNQCEAALDLAFSNKPAHPLLRAGKSRWGSEVVGGIIWCDIDEFALIENVNQIFGHTKVREETWFINDGQNSRNVCIDNVINLCNYAVHDGKTDKITIKNTRKIK
jgi:hypothetical protein